MFTHPVRTRSANSRPRRRSAVKIAESSPYGEALVSEIACSRDPIATTGAIGPNVSSTATRASGGTSVSTVGCQYSEVAKPVGARPAADHARAALERVANVLVHLGRHRLVVERAHRRRIVERVAEQDPLRRPGGPAARRTRPGRRGERGCARPRCSSGRRTGSRRSASRRPRPARSASSITTSGPLPPISSSAAFPAAAWATSRPVAVEPMNATPSVPGLRAISSPTTGPGPVTRLNTPGGRSASAMHAGERHRAHRGRRRRRPHHRVAARQRGRDQLRRHRVRPVPRADHADHAARAARPASPACRARTSWAARRRAAWRPRPPSASTRPARRPRRTPRPASGLP